MKMFGHPTRRLLRMGALVLLAAVGTAPGAWSAQTAQVPPKPENKPHRTSWEMSAFTYIKLVRMEPGAPGNDHPVEIRPELLASQLGAVQFIQPGGAVNLFGKDEIAQLSQYLSQAFSQARPGEDVILVSTGRRERGILSDPLTLTARMFWQDGALQFIVHHARLNWYMDYRIKGIHPTFEPGSRKVASEVRIQSPGGLNQRADWLALSQPVPAPVAAPQAASPAVPAQVAVAVPPARDAALDAQQEERLRALNHLRDEKLISEDEYQIKLADVLK